MRISTSDGAAEFAAALTSPRMQRIELRAHFGEIGRTGRRARLDQRAAEEVDAVIEPDRQIKRRPSATVSSPEKAKPRTMPAHEIDFRHAPDDDQRLHRDSITSEWREMRTSGGRS